MSGYCIQLGEGLRVSPAAYLTALRTAMANPAGKFSQSFNDPRGWCGTYTGAEIVAEWRAMLHTRWADRTMAQHTYGKGSKANKRVQAIRDNAGHLQMVWFLNRVG